MNYKDIPYNFLIGGDGALYEGRGFDFNGELPSNRSTFQNIGLVVAFVGDFSTQRPSHKQISAFNQFLTNSVNRDFVSRDFILLEAEQVTNSERDMTGLIEILTEREEFYSRKFDFRFHLAGD